MQKIILLTVLCLYNLTAFTQSDFTIRSSTISKIEQLSINEGLSQGVVSDVMQDKYGFLWMATKDGLNKYDGYNFTIYRNDIYDSTSISDNDLYLIKEDHAGRLWILTRNQGLNLFDRSTGSFLRINEYTQARISSNYINNFIFLPDNSLLLLTNKGFDRVAVSSDHEVEVNPVTAKDREFTYSGCNNIYIDAQDQIWVSDKHNIYKFHIDLIKNTYTVTPHPYDFSTSDTFKNCIEVIHFLEDTINKFIYLRHPMYIIRLNQLTGKTLVLNFKTLIGAIYPYAIELDPDGNLWGTVLNKFIKIDISRNEIIYYESSEFEDIILFSSRIYRDRSNNLWLTTSGYGLLKLFLRKELFNHFSGDTPKGFSTRRVVPLPDGKLAIGSWNYTHLRVFDPYEMKFVDQYPYAQSEIYKLYPGFNHSFLNFAITKEGDKIFANNEKFILRTNASETEVVKIYESKNKSYYFPLYVSNNYLWFGNGGKLVRLDLNDNSYISYKIPFDQRINNFYQNEINQILEDKNGGIWLATINGIFYLNIKKGTWTRYKIKKQSFNGLSADIVYSLCIDPKEPDKYIWFGTNGAGLGRFNFIDNKLTHFTTKDGLPNNIVYGILPDDEGHLWMSTNKGISKFKVSEKKFTNFEEKDGLQSNEFNRYAYYKLPDNRLLFGGVNGFNLFDPTNIRISTQNPPINLTTLYIHNKPYNVAQFKVEESGQLKIDLKHHQNVLRFEFASMDMTSPDKNLFRYKMEGIDEEFSPPSTKHEATYTALTPGKYTFSVMGTNVDGVWSEQQLNLVVNILPPWWATWWFKLLIILVVAIIIYGVYQYRLRQAQKIYAIRDSIASDLHDEIGSTLSSIALYGAVAKNAAQHNNEQAIKLLDKINDSTENIMESMSDIIWAINTRNDKFDNIVNKMQAFAVQLLELKQCQVHFINESDFKGTQLNMTQRKNFYLFYKEAINNISKYADSKNVWIEVGLKKNIVKLYIKDDGKGMSAKVHEFKTGGGNGLYNLRKRADELKGSLKIDSSEGQGTEIVLIFKK